MIDFLNLPPSVYKWVVIGIGGTFYLGWKFNLLKFVHIKVSLPEDFMRNLRWITPLNLAILNVFFAIQCFLLWNLIQVIQSLVKVQ